MTDANLVLGRYDPGSPLGGSLTLDPGRAREAIAYGIAAPLGMSVEQAAAGIVRIVNAPMAGAVRTISLERGRDVRDFTLVAFGGAGPVHGGGRGAELGVERILVPPCPGCTSALGAVTADSRHDMLTHDRAAGVRSLARRCCGAVVEDLGEQAREALAREGFGEAERDSSCGSTCATKARPTSWRSAPGDLHSSRARCWRRRWSSSTGCTLTRRPLLRGRDGGAGERAGDGIRASRRARRCGGTGLCPGAPRGAQNAHGVLPGGAATSWRRRVLRRERSRRSRRSRGPAVIHQLDATVLVPPGMTAMADPSGGLILQADPNSATRAGRGGAEGGAMRAPRRRTAR